MAFDHDADLADLAIFDPATVADRATREPPAARSAGVDVVIVGRTIAVRDFAETGAATGRLVRRP